MFTVVSHHSRNCPTLVSFISTIAILLGATTALGETVFIVRESTGAVTIPVFDTGLGTLTGVSLDVILLASPISAAASHQHVLHPSPPEVTISGQGQALNIPTFLSAASGVHTHSIGISSIVIGTKTLGAISSTTSVDPNHQHAIDFPPISGSYDIFSNETQYNLPTILSDLAGAHSHSHPSPTQSEVFGAGELAVFLGVSDFGIPRLTSLSSIGSHEHVIDPPLFSVPLVGGGSEVVNIPTFLSDSAGGHGHSLSANWRTEATFTFEPIPEPSSIALAASGVLGIGCYVWRRRRRS